MSGSPRVAVVGASGFVGAAVVTALVRRGCEVQAVTAPRVPALAPDAADGVVEREARAVQVLASLLEGATAVVNAAGMADAGAHDSAVLNGANAGVPAVVAAAARTAGVARVVHVSSAAVQGRRRVLDESMQVEPFSPYSRSKALGELLALRHGGDAVVIYRPPGVHGAGRATTRSLAALARSRLASVARPGTDPSPQALIDNVGDAVAFLVTCQEQPPRVVIHPWEGVTTAGLMRDLGGRAPVMVPRWLARLLVRSARLLGVAHPSLAAQARRLEMLWFGQAQADSWLTAAGWTARHGRAEWQELGRDARPGGRAGSASA